MGFVATVSTPGYPTIHADGFASAEEAWEYLAWEREAALEATGEEPSLEDVWHYLVAQSEEATGDGTGHVEAGTPGHMGTRDLVTTYRVEKYEGNAH